MKRDLHKLANTQFDVLIIGGGIYGATAAWECALRGLSVALIEKRDFGGATSSNSLKIIHGGLRYLQHADFIRMRESIVERRTVMRIAPHLITVFPCLMPTYGHQIKGPEVMAIAMLMNDVISFDRNHGLDDEHRLPMGRIVSKKEVRKLIPHVDNKNLTAGAMWYDAQVYNSERLLFSYLQSAAAKGAESANYVKAVKYLTANQKVLGVQARDELTGQTFDIRSRMVLNNAGAWTDSLLADFAGNQRGSVFNLSTAMNLLVRRQLTVVGAGVSAKLQFKDRDAVVSKGSRLLFVAPWRDISMIGTWHDPYDGHPDAFQPSEARVTKMLSELNDALPGADLQREEVILIHRGFLPMVDVHPVSGDVRLQKHYHIVDHRKDLQVDGLLSVVSVKYTTARDVAVKTADAIFKKWGQKPPVSSSHITPIDGGEMENVSFFIQDEIRRNQKVLAEKAIRHLIHNYGSSYRHVVAHSAPEELAPVANNSDVMKAEILHGIRDEMAMKLSDVVLRRTELGSAGYPGKEAVTVCAQLMAKELGWSKARQQTEIKEVEQIYPNEAICTK